MSELVDRLKKAIQNADILREIRDNLHIVDNVYKTHFADLNVEFFKVRDMWLLSVDSGSDTRLVFVMILERDPELDEIPEIIYETLKRNLS